MLDELFQRNASKLVTLLEYEKLSTIRFSSILHFVLLYFFSLMNALVQQLRPAKNYSGQNHDNIVAFQQA